MARFDGSDEELQNHARNLSYKKDKDFEDLELDDPDAKRGITDSFKEYCPACKHTVFVPARTGDGSNALQCKKCGQITPLCPSCNHLTLVPYTHGMFKCSKCAYKYIPFGKP